MRKSSAPESGLLCPRFQFALVFCLAGTFLELASLAAAPVTTTTNRSISSPASGQWTIVSSPNASAGQNYLSTVTCPSASDCWAAGFYYDANNLVKTLLEHGTSTGWTIQ